MRVALSKLLAPGDSVTIAFPFREQIPRQIRRSGWMSREGVEYSMAQWYPKICEYDAEGWQHQEYVSREFYGVWGDFHVEMTLPARYTVGATGQCMNPSEVGHGYDQIAAGVKAGLQGPTASSGMTTWKFHAAHVHDFAWVADDDYIHEWMTWQDTITIHSFYKSWARSYWEKNALAYSLFALSTYNHDFGPYAYRNFSCTMAGDGGMEYPQLIMITGYRPNPLSLAGVIAHEVGHQWFYGMLGSNETREAFMDEGFTTYATTMAMNALFGDHQEYPGEPHSWLDWFIPKFSNKRDNYRFYQEIASQGYEEPLDIPHDWFREDVTAGLVYGKTAAILNMLQYTLGDSTFAAGMKEYYGEWRFKHPHLLDFQRVMEKVSHTDLAWFFDEWFKTTRTVDYAACGVKSTPAFSRRGQGAVDSGYTTTVTLHNNRLAVMPLDLLLHYNDGTSEAATIPLAVNKNLDYHKDGVSHYFPSWDWVAPNYSGSIITPKPVSWFEIDTSWRLQDLNWLNNYAGLLLPPGEWAVLKQLFVNPPIDKYYAVVRPIIWPDDRSSVNGGAGIKFGMNNSFSGDLKLIYKRQAEVWEQVDDNGNAFYPRISWYDFLDGALNFNTPVAGLGRLTNFDIDAEKMYGISTMRASLTKTFRPEFWRLGTTQSASIFVEDQQLSSIDNYPIWHPGWGFIFLDEFGDGLIYGMHTRVAGLHYSVVSELGNTRFDLTGESSILASALPFSRAEAVFTSMVPIVSDMNFHIRAAAGTATGYTPYQRQFLLARADNYEEQNNGFFRALSSINEPFSQNTSMFLDGGAGVRGYNAGNSAQYAEYIYGDRMAGLNLDLDLPNPLSPIWGIGALNPGVFADAGWIGGDSLRADAGIKLGLNLLSLLPSQLRGVAEEYDKIPIVYLDIPLYENRPLDGKPNIAWRWAVSLGAGF
ncbi:MAG TPA: M1 family aminopeptidase [Candidatus Kapabacteria bacterium]|nr:M1 family aminopeptidase [Candidatus Kapabacteria bacterium]